MAKQGPEMEMRDPNDLNEHIKVCWDDVFGEPEGVRSIDCIWRTAYTCFEFGKGFCYKLITLLCGMCIALWWGCDFAMTAVSHVWCWTPCMRDFTICIGCWRKIFTSITGCCLGPICQACGMCLSQIQIKKM